MQPEPRRFKPGRYILLALVLLGLAWWALRQDVAFEPALETGCAGDRAPGMAAPRAAPSSLRQARVMLNPGHGFMLTEDGVWGFQRPQANGWSVFVLEDDSNVRLARAVRDALIEAGAEVLATRELDATEPGVSGEPRWREATRHHLKAADVPKWVWNSRGLSLHNDCRMGQDLRARALYANVSQADVLISLHSNAGAPFARGSQVIHASRSFLRAAPDDLAARSACLAQTVAERVPDAIRARRPDLGWTDAELIESNQYGENGFALMPSVILEVAFHTNATDGQALREASFRRAVAGGIRAALEEFFGRGCP